MIGGEYQSASTERRRSPNVQRKGTENFRVAIEGNIASGKSTLLAQLDQLNNVEVLVEPVEKWRTLSGNNLIGRMYDDAHRWGYLFQSYVLLTMMELHHKKVDSPVVLLERSVYSARYCFVENLRKNGIIDEAEYGCYCHWFDYITSQNPPHLDLIVYLRSSPEVCYQRLLQRGRKEEKTVSLEYLESLHERYEDWLGNSKHHCWHGNTPVLVLDANQDSSENRTIYSKHCSSILHKLGIGHCLTHNIV